MRGGGLRQINNCRPVPVIFKKSQHLGLESISYFKQGYAFKGGKSVRRNIHVQLIGIMKLTLRKTVSISLPYISKRERPQIMIEALVF
jgi:hypothetical protein